MTIPPIDGDPKQWAKFAKQRQNHARTLKILNVCGLVFSACYLGLIWLAFYSDLT